MVDKKPNNNEIIKALEYWKKFDNEIDQMLSGRFKDNKMLIEQKEIVKITLNLFDLINRQKAIIEKSEKVEHFADKTIETANAEIENLKVENQSLRSAANSLKMHYKEAQTKIESLKIFRGYAEKRASDYKTMRDKYLNAKSEAAKEFTERIKELIRTKEFTDDVAMLLCAFIDNICKEMVGDDNA